MTSEWILDLRHFGGLVVLQSRLLAVVSHNEKSYHYCLSIIVRTRWSCSAQSFDGAQHAQVKSRDSQRSSLRASENASVERIVSAQRRACCQHRGGQSCRLSESQGFALHLFDRNAALLLRRWWAKEGCMSKWAHKGTACGGSLRNVSLACSVCGPTLTPASCAEIPCHA
jgi:hypothetical protein